MIIDTAGIRYIMSIHEPLNRFIELNISIEINATKQPNIEPTDTILDAMTAIVNTIKADIAEGIKIINRGPMPVATPLPPLNL